MLQTLCGDNGVKKLISGLEGNTKLLVLSLCYCDLGPQSGSALGTIVARTAICNLYINGNSLQCLGATKLLKPMADFAESLGREWRANGLLYSNDTAYQNPAVANEEAGINSKVVSSNATSKTDRPITLESTGKKKKRKGLKKKIKKLDPGPWLTKLHLVDNAIDKRLNQTEKSIMEFIQLLICLIKNSEHLVEIDINGNAIGEQCAVKVLEAVKDRRKEEMPGLKIKVTPQISSATFREIFKSCSKPSPTKKKKKKKIK
ncbi:uncharacterized protein LOC125437509 isoform X2 [Sphaerodactylus townsendi]|uniref:uncharacterized protein LOC125437509 isoform X2 n=1 Tax=Sphaerodactylus townsendi TaxID=933632 RepID=UPI002025E4E7|nr:uncharacterized protein LOC125437509 isoform X2 [Sphaerodactylus townsendi]